MSQARVLCVGRVYCDLVFTGTPRLPTPGTEVFAEGLSLHGGGGAFITGATMAALGHPVGLMAHLPGSPFDNCVSRDLAAHGIDTRLCRPAPAGVDPQITVVMAGAGDRAFLTRADGPALPPLSGADLSAFDHLHIGELGTLQQTPGILDHARAAGLTVSLDCGWQDSFAPELAALVSEVDVFLPNAAEAAALAAIGLPDTCARLTVVKSGADGARGRHRDDSDWMRAAATPVAVVDATGAGDAFNGGFLSAWLAGEPLSTAMARGNACGAAAVQAVGGVGGLAGPLRSVVSN